MKARQQRIIPDSPLIGPASGALRYVQLASVIRQRIASGEWAVGMRLPTVEGLASQFSLSKITVRQAISILRGEGLLSAQVSKGIFVVGLPEKPTPGMHSAINDVFAGTNTLTIQVLSTAQNVALPPALGLAASGKTFTVVRKIHLHNDVPFCFAEIYVAQDIYKKIKGQEKRFKIGKLIRDVLGDRIGVSRQTITVEPAELHLAQKISLSFAAPVARIQRSTYDKKGTIVTAGLSWYRGDMFVLDIELPTEMTQNFAETPIPDSKI